MLTYFCVAFRFFIVSRNCEKIEVTNIKSIDFGVVRVKSNGNRCELGFDLDFDGSEGDGRRLGRRLVWAMEFEFEFEVANELEGQRKRGKLRERERTNGEDAGGKARRES